LCHKCLSDGPIKYTRKGLHDCGRCPDTTANYLKISGLFMALLAVIAVLLYFNLKRTTESETSAVLRMMTNYIQILTATAAFNLQWPEYLDRMFSAITNIGDSSESYISFDCILQECTHFDVTPFRWNWRGSSIHVLL